MLVRKIVLMNARVVVELVIVWHHKPLILATVFVEVLKRSIGGILANLYLLLIVKELCLEGIDCMGAYMVRQTAYFFK